MRALDWLVYVMDWKESTKIRMHLQSADYFVVLSASPEPGAKPHKRDRREIIGSSSL